MVTLSGFTVPPHFQVFFHVLFKYLLEIDKQIVLLFVVNQSNNVLSLPKANVAHFIFELQNALIVLVNLFSCKYFKN